MTEKEFLLRIKEILQHYNDGAIYYFEMVDGINEATSRAIGNEDYMLDVEKNAE